jgi:UDPglucose 6-dehydrogenase
MGWYTAPPSISFSPPTTRTPHHMADSPICIDGLRVVCIGAGYVGGPTMAVLAASELWREESEREGNASHFQSVSETARAPCGAFGPAAHRRRRVDVHAPAGGGLSGFEMPPAHVLPSLSSLLPPRAVHSHPTPSSPPHTPTPLECPTVTVTVVDSWKDRIDAWNSSELPIYEPGLDALVAATRGRNLFFTSDDINRCLSDADIIFVSVNTPTKSFGIGAGHASNVKNIELCARTIAAACRTSKIVVEKSTVPVKTAETLRRILAANAPAAPAAPAVASDGKGLVVVQQRRQLEHQILSNPEFLAEGTAVRDLESPSRVLIGGDQSTPAGQRAIATLAALYAAWVPRDRIITTNVWSSELSKLVANAFLAQRISSVNSISALCEATGADVDEVSRAIGTDPRIGPHFLKASVGFGGSCFQKDILSLVYLCRTHGLAAVADYWEGVVAMNDFQKGRFAAGVVERLFHTVTGKKLALLGFAFKKDTGDVRESAAAYVAKALLAERAELHVFDPKVKRASMLEELAYSCGVTGETVPDLESLLTTAPDPYEACRAAHAAVVLTEWDQFRALDWARIYNSMQQPAFVFDGRNILDHGALRRLGFEVYAVGKPVVGDLTAVVMGEASGVAGGRALEGAGGGGGRAGGATSDATGE